MIRKHSCVNFTNIWLLGLQSSFTSWLGYIFSFHRMVWYLFRFIISTWNGDSLSANKDYLSDQRLYRALLSIYISGEFPIFCYRFKKSTSTQFESAITFLLQFQDYAMKFVRRHLMTSWKKPPVYPKHVPVFCSKKTEISALLSYCIRVRSITD